MNKWVAEGRIRAFRTPGGHRRIRVRDLVEFLEVHSMPIPREPMPYRSGACCWWMMMPVSYARCRGCSAATKIDSGVSTASHGIDALLRVGSFKPHLVVLDMLMPGIDGLEVCRRLKANPETKSTRVIMVSGHWAPKAEKEALVAGAQRCMTKPIDPVIVMQELGIDLTNRESNRDLCDAPGHASQSPARSVHSCVPSCSEWFPRAPVC